MSPDEYGFLVKDRPELRLPHWNMIPDWFRDKLRGMAPEDLVAARTAVILGRRDPEIPETTDGRPLNVLGRENPDKSEGSERPLFNPLERDNTRVV